jgi:hypothetical protein
MKGTAKLMRFITGCVLMGSMLLSGSSGLVLCVGDEGHVAVESVHHDHCGHSHHGEVPGHKDTAHPDVADAASCAGVCVDVPLTIDTASLVAKTLKGEHLFASVGAGTISADHTSLAFASSRGLLRPPCEAMLRLVPSLIEKRIIVLRV